MVPYAKERLDDQNLEILMCIADGSVKQSEAKTYLVTCIHHFNS